MLYKLGKVISKAKTYLILESNYTGYAIYTPNVDKFELGKFQKIFIYEHENEYVHTLYGFKDFKERLFFEDLLSIPGIGPKTALGILSHGWSYVLEIIAQGDFEELSKLPYIGIRTAKQIIFELQSKYQNILNKKSESKNRLEVFKTLKTLGFNQTQINLLDNKLIEEENIDLMIEKAIEIISNEQQHNTIKAQ